MAQNVNTSTNVVKISQLPDGQPTHLVGVSVTEGTTVKYSVEKFTSERRHDFNVYSYCAKAPGGSNENSPVWTITRIEILEDGTTNKVTLSKVAWSSRYSLTYV